MVDKAQKSPRTKRCFIISPIGDAGSDVRRRSDKILKHIVRPVCNQLGFAAVRADEINHTSLISRRVMEEILTSDLVIADLTGRNPNVYYELAVRHFIGKPVVQLLESAEQLPFDVSDLNTIRFDHTDLDSVHDAKEKLEQFILATDSSTKCHNPVSATLELLDIHVSENREGKKSLVETFRDIATQIIDELHASKQERELLWKKLFDAPTETPNNRSPTGIDLSGAWKTNVGIAKVIQDGDTITGKYQYGGEWVGELTGRLVGTRVIFEFRWIMQPIQGVGFLDYVDGALVGRWYYDREVLYTLRDLIKDPELLDREPIALSTREDRLWIFTRKDSRSASPTGSQDKWPE